MGPNRSVGHAISIALEGRDLNLDQINERSNVVNPLLIGTFERYSCSISARTAAMS